MGLFFGPLLFLYSLHFPASDGIGNSNSKYNLATLKMLHIVNKPPCGGLFLATQGNVFKRVNSCTEIVNLYINTVNARLQNC